MQKAKKLILASDHAGFELKQKLKPVLEQNEIEYDDLTPELDRTDDYPEHAFKAARKAARENTRAILICGTGIGMCMSANKIKGIRAANAYDEKTARLSRQHNDANVLCLGARTVGEEEAKKIVKAWLTTRFLEGRHARRVNKIKEFERKY